jgi:hypothetical protein
METVRPNLFQFIAYAHTQYRLPDRMRDWVAHDLAGKRALRRFMLRAAIPPLLVLAPFWLLPVSAGNSIYVHSEMTVPIYVWAMLVLLALNKVWRRHRLAQHGLDPNLVDASRRAKDAKMREDYIRRYGPRPEEAERQANSNPFF